MNKRILFVIGSLEVGGAERHLTQVAVQLKLRGWDPEVFVLVPGGPLTPVLQQENIPIHGFPLPKWVGRLLKNDRLIAWVGLLFTALALVSTLWRRRPDVIHFFLPAAYIVGGVASLPYPFAARIMSRRSMNHYQSKHRLFSRIERRLHPHMVLVCGNSEAVISQLQEEGIESKRLRLIYNGIGLKQFEGPFDRSAKRRSMQISGDALVFIMVANLISYKGHDDLLDALGEIRDELPASWTFLCVGRDDGIGKALCEKARKYGIGDRVRFTGSRSDVPDLLRLADIGVLCSHEEGFSNAVLEGMAAGLPMVVTDVGGNAEAVINGENGYVVPSKDPSRLADALLKMARYINRGAMAVEAKRRAEQCFSMDACIDGYELMYHDVLATHRKT